MREPDDMQRGGYLNTAADIKAANASIQADCEAVRIAARLGDTTDQKDSTGFKSLSIVQLTLSIRDHQRVAAHTRTNQHAALAL